MRSASMLQNANRSGRYSRLRILFVLFIIIGTGVFGAKKLHYHNYSKGRNELDALHSVPATDSQRDDNFYYIAHAGGIYQGITYTNTLDAIENSCKAGVKFIELDFNYSKDSVVVLSHDFVDVTANAYCQDMSNGRHLSLVQLLDWLGKKQVKIITDIKVDNLKILRWISANHPHLQKQLIPQAYTISEVSQIRAMGYESVIFTNYISQYPNSIIWSLAQRGDLFGITMPYDWNFKAFIFFRDIKKSKTRIFTHSVNDIHIVTSLKAEGCHGVYTDVLLQPVDKR
jgi:glycerophosphoryl diester phosphodiesterase